MRILKFILTVLISLILMFCIMFLTCSFIETTIYITEWEKEYRILCVGVTLIVSAGVGIEFLNDTK